MNTTKELSHKEQLFDLVRALTNETKEEQLNKYNTNTEYFKAMNHLLKVQQMAMNSQTQQDEQMIQDMESQEVFNNDFKTINIINQPLPLKHAPKPKELTRIIITWRQFEDWADKLMNHRMITTRHHGKNCKVRAIYGVGRYEADIEYL